MNAMLVVLLVAVATAVLYTVLRGQAPSFALFLVLAAALVIVWKLGGAADEAVQWALSLQGRVDGEAFKCLLKAVGIVLCADYGKLLCKDAGAESVGWCVELAGRCFVLAAAYPLLREVCGMVLSLAG